MNFLKGVFSIDPSPKWRWPREDWKLGGMKRSIWRKAQREMCRRNGNFGRAILEFANKWLKNKKGRKKGNKYYLETYLEGVKILFFEDCCVVKAKCYRS